MEVSKANFIFLKDVNAAGASASEKSDLCIFIKDISALYAREKPQVLQEQAEVRKAHFVFLLKDTSAALKMEEPQAQQAQVGVIEANSVFLSKGYEHRWCKGENASAVYEGLTTSVTGSQK